jgi:hypothetical protein
VLVRYTITSKDLEGPFVEHIPNDMMEKSQLPVLAYTSPLEALAVGSSLDDYNMGKVRISTGFANR